MHKIEKPLPELEVGTPTSKMRMRSGNSTLARKGIIVEESINPGRGFGIDQWIAYPSEHQ